MKRVARAILLSWLMMAGPALAATQVLEDGRLVGAKGVIVDGVGYNVTFSDGSCASVFGRCTTEDLDFRSEALAQRAAKALLDQVFVNGDAGRFDDLPGLTRGCTADHSSPFPATCGGFVPFEVVNGQITAFWGGNSSRETSDAVFRASYPDNFDFTQIPSFTYARFTTAAVPEPAAWALMILGFSLVGATMRQRRWQAAA